MSKWNDIITAFCTALSAQRAAPFVDEEDLPFRSVFDLNDEAQKERYKKHTVTTPVIVASNVDGGADEGLALDTELAALQSAAASFADSNLLVESIAYTGRQYDYSENGSSVVTVVATFDITYTLDLSNP